MRSLLICVFAVSVFVASSQAQQTNAANSQDNRQQVQQSGVADDATAAQQVASQTAVQIPAQSVDAPKQYTVPAGTQLLVRLQAPINTKTAQPGNGVYLQTIFPITIGNKVVIPVGSFVQGTIDKVVRPGRVKGRAQVQMHFTTLILPSGYTMSLPGALDDVPGAEGVHRNGAEGTLERDRQTGKDVGTIAEGAGVGTVATAATLNPKAIGIGAGVGAAAGLLYTLLSRGDDIRIEAGTQMEMVLQRPLVLEERKVEEANAHPTQLVPVDTVHVLEKHDRPIGIAPVPCGQPTCF